MTTTRIAKIILLVEDQTTESLLRRYLQRLGDDNRNIRVRRIQDGRGSGEQFVRERYASEVRVLRTSHTKACLIVSIDADTKTTSERRQQLERALRDAEEPAREARERILNLVPKRNIETWILCLNSAADDETTDYRHDSRVDPKSIRSAAQALYAWTRPNALIPDICVASLTECLPEFDRIPE
ncbi:MAG: hypothetical protein P4L56_01965 [Candidatus Sulfopaludibacter sp.]|nr:hypothetical protein [Candidatus Sulfopaludibacter sp.]